ncbi:MAG TPA: hypothetical protein VJU16_07310, partial [Planctomycetota bacterium]|nr:hypothetical protein [Planctomycetota bacterium]
ISGLKTKGFIGYGGPGEVTLTVEGRQHAGDVGPLRPEDILEKCQAVIVTPQARLMSALAKAFPNDLSREDLAAQCDTTTGSSSFEKNVSGLKTADMATYSGKGRVRCAAWIFGERE